jgi:hypothetical protein
MLIPFITRGLLRQAPKLAAISTNRLVIISFASAIFATAPRIPLLDLYRLMTYSLQGVLSSVNPLLRGLLSGFISPILLKDPSLGGSLQMVCNSLGTMALCYRFVRGCFSLGLL